MSFSLASIVLEVDEMKLVQGQGTAGECGKAELKFYAKRN